MAAGTFVVYDSAKLKLGGADIDLDSATFQAVMLDFSYSYNANHSSFSGQIVSFEVSDASSSGSLIKTLTNVNWTLSAANSLKFDADDIVFTASAAVKAKYVLIKNNNVPVCIMNTDTGTTTGVEATTITVQLPADGFFKVSQNN